MSNSEIVKAYSPIQKKIKARGTILSSAIVGSYAYGLNNELSDLDFLGVYQAPTVQIAGMGLFSPKPTVHKAAEEADYTFHELGKFVDLACKANPTILELLFFDGCELVDMDDSWNLLLDNKHVFLSTAVRRTYGGYAKQQLEKRRRREKDGKMGFGPKTAYRTGKHARHLMRLMLQCKGLLETGEITLKLTPEEIEIVRAAETMDFKDLEETFNEWTLKLTGIQTSLPPEPDYKQANEILLALRGL